LQTVSISTSKGVCHEKGNQKTEQNGSPESDAPTQAAKSAPPGE
jgi:hypothetical protein